MLGRFGGEEGVRATGEIELVSAFYSPSWLGADLLSSFSTQVQEEPQVVSSLTWSLDNDMDCRVSSETESLRLCHRRN